MKKHRWENQAYLLKSRWVFSISELFCNLLEQIAKEDKDAQEASKSGSEIEITNLDETLNETLQKNFKNIEASAVGTGFIQW